MKLIKSESEWQSYKAQLPSSYNLDGPVLGSPIEYPCLVISRPQVDAGGIRVVNTFVYKGDAQRLLEL